VHWPGRPRPSRRFARSDRDPQALPELVAAAGQVGGLGRVARQQCHLRAVKLGHRDGPATRSHPGGQALAYQPVPLDAIGEFTQALA
jgi:hypothetical protein